MQIPMLEDAFVKGKYDIHFCFYNRLQYHRYGSGPSGSMDEVPLMMSDGGFETDENDYLMSGSSKGRNRGLGCWLTDGWKNACSK